MQSRHGQNVLCNIPRRRAPGRPSVCDSFAPTAKRIEAYERLADCLREFARTRARQPFDDTI